MARALLSRVVWVGVGLTILCQAGVAGAATYSVNPTRVVLTARATTALVTVRNDGDEPLRFQMSVFVWNQDARGQMQLAPTEDMIVFPLMMALQPKQERSVRVGAATPFGTTEKSYRLIIEELPPPERPGQPTGVRVLTRMSVPIFLQPQSPKASASLTDVALGPGGLTFTLRNTGNVFFIPDAITVKAMDQHGIVLHERALEPWYVLAAGSRVFEVAVPRPLCEQVRSFAISVDIGKSSLKQRLETPASACGQ
jgi:fimbrial chaperone protein